MRSETRQGIFKLMIIIMSAMIFMTVLAIAITIGVMAAEWLDPTHGWVWSGVFWASLFGAIALTTWIAKRFFNLF